MKHSTLKRHETWPGVHGLWTGYPSLGTLHIRTVRRLVARINEDNDRLNYR
jgi:hypothetical protein